ncbi:hypothetical protein AKJ16_DCAP22771 [Drosera capensis]
MQRCGFGAVSMTSSRCPNLIAIRSVEYGVGPRSAEVTSSSPAISQLQDLSSRLEAFPSRVRVGNLLIRDHKKIEHNTIR